MKPQISHSMNAHQKKPQEGSFPVKDVPVHTVLPAEDEQFARQMKEAESHYAEALNVAPVAQNANVDAILDREMKKREVFNKLVLFKEDHYTEVEVAGLKFRL